MAARDMKYNLRQDENESMRVIIDCDPGNGVPGANIDDGLALALAIAAPQITLEMITTVAGNTPVETGYAVAKALVRQLDIPVPVYRGAARALREDPQPWREKLDRGVDRAGLRQLWSDVPAPPTCQAAQPLAPQAIGELICNHPGEITLIATGPLTNVAIALQLYPEIVHTVKNIVIMGGVFNVAGYIKDTNFGLDPEAAHAVLTSGAPVTLEAAELLRPVRRRSVAHPLLSPQFFSLLSRTERALDGSQEPQSQWLGLRRRDSGKPERPADAAARDAGRYGRVYVPVARPGRQR